MTVKDVLQSLVDDNMVDSERVGTSNYYWAFPSKALHARKHKLEELQKQVKGARLLLVKMVTSRQQLQVLRDKIKEREQHAVIKTLRVCCRRWALTEFKQRFLCFL